jgi:hypothetical protein
MSRSRDFADLAGSADAGGLTGRNLIINGAMHVAQRGTVTSVTAGYGGPDRFKLIRAGASAFTLSKDSDAPTGSGFTSSLKIDVTTADASLAATDSVQILQQIEAQNLQRIKKGTSSAESLTLSFWIKSSVTGTYIVEWYEHDNSRHINKSYTISSADTWEFKTITIPGDTSGVIDNDNGAGIQLSWWLMAGTDYNPVSGTLQTSWGALDNTGRAVGQVNAVNDAANNIYLTGVQLEVGETATPFEHEDFSTTLAKCQRYYEISGITLVSSIVSVYPSGQWAVRKNRRPDITITPAAGSGATISPLYDGGNVLDNAGKAAWFQSTNHASDQVCVVFGDAEL